MLVWLCYNTVSCHISLPRICDAKHEAFITFILRLTLPFRAILLAVLLPCFDTVVWRQEEHRACTNWVIWCWCGYLSGARCRLQTLCMWSSWCHYHTKTPPSLAAFKSRLVSPFWYRLTQVVAERRPLNGCSSSIIISIIYMQWFGDCCELANEASRV